MDKICQFGTDGSIIWEDGDYWVVTDAAGKNPEKIEKERKPTYPLAMVTNFGWTGINIKRLEELEALV
jgi:hypothetical protein